MLASRRLLQHACRVTLFTRDNCGLCAAAKGVLSNVWDRRPFAFREVDLARPESKAWRELYDFDIPVVRSRPRPRHGAAPADAAAAAAARSTSVAPRPSRSMSTASAGPSS